MASREPNGADGAAVDQVQGQQLRQEKQRSLSSNSGSGNQGNYSSGSVGDANERVSRDDSYILLRTEDLLHGNLPDLESAVVAPSSSKKCVAGPEELALKDQLAVFGGFMEGVFKDLISEELWLKMGLRETAPMLGGDDTPPNIKTGNSFFGIKRKNKKTVLPLIPIVYSPDYNITWYGLQKLHPFDSTKYRNVVHTLKLMRRATPGPAFEESQLIKPVGPIPDEYLRRIHTPRYLESLKNKSVIARITEVAPIAMLPINQIETRLLKPFRTMCTGSVLAARVALQQGVGVNLGGGFHHCSSDEGGGFCAYADITLIIWFLRTHVFGPRKIAIIDLDAHQGNGHARDKAISECPSDILILDIYNQDIYPQDHDAKAHIDIECAIESYTKDDTYLKEVAYGLRRLHEESFARWGQLPHLVIYNAGTDILENDSLGCLSISERGVKDRDRMVFEACRNGNWFQKGEAALAPHTLFDKPVPVCMLLSGGYQKSNARVIAESLYELQKYHPEYGLLAPPSRHGEECDPNCTKKDKEKRASKASGLAASPRVSKSFEKNAGKTGLPGSDIKSAIDSGVFRQAYDILANDVAATAVADAASNKGTAARSERVANCDADSGVMTSTGEGAADGRQLNSVQVIKVNDLEALERGLNEW